MRTAAFCCAAFVQIALPRPEFIQSIIEEVQRTEAAKNEDARRSGAGAPRRRKTIDRRMWWLGLRRRHRVPLAVDQGPLSMLLRCNHSGIVRGDWPAQLEWVQAVVPTFRARRGVSKRARVLGLEKCRSPLVASRSPRCASGTCRTRCGDQTHLAGRAPLIAIACQNGCVSVLVLFPIPN